MLRSIVFGAPIVYSVEGHQLLMLDLILDTLGHVRDQPGYQSSHYKHEVLQAEKAVVPSQFGCRYRTRII